MAARSALAEGFTHYTSSRGLLELRAAIAARFRERRGVVRDPADEVIITPSAKHAVFISLMAVLDPGDEVLVPTPSWVSYGAMARLAGARPVPVPLSSEENFEISRSQLESFLSPHTKAIVLNTPNNPTGRVFGAAELQDIAMVAEARDLIIISDEIYEDIVFEGAVHRSPVEFQNCAHRTLVVSGFSKTYAMTGWRLGHVSGPRSLMKEVLKVQEHTVGEAGSFIQRGGLAALAGDQGPVRAMVAEYARRREWAYKKFQDVPRLSCALPEGTFYLFPDVSDLGFSDSHSCAQWLIESCGVVVTPGSAFGAGGEGHIRLSLTAPPSTVEAGISRLCEALSALG